MTAVTIEQTRSRRPELIEQGDPGEPIVILRGTEPVAKLTKRLPNGTAADETTTVSQDGYERCVESNIFAAEGSETPPEDIKVSLNRFR